MQQNIVSPFWVLNTRRMFQWDCFLLKAVCENRRWCLLCFRCLATFFLPPWPLDASSPSMLPSLPGVLVLRLSCPVAGMPNSAYSRSSFPRPNFIPTRKSMVPNKAIFTGHTVMRTFPTWQFHIKPIHVKLIADASRLAQLPWYLQIGKANTMWLEFGQGPGPTSQKEVWRPNCQQGFGTTSGDPEHTIYLQHFAWWCLWNVGSPSASACHNSSNSQAFIQSLLSFSKENPCSLQTRCTSNTTAQHPSEWLWSWFRTKHGL